MVDIEIFTKNLIESFKEPKLKKAIYNSSSIHEIIKNHTAELRATGKEQLIDLAEKLDIYKQNLEDKEYRAELRSTFTSLYDVLIGKHPDLLFNCDGRWKSLISYYNKAKSSKELKDLNAFRLTILDSKQNKADVKMCYEVLETFYYFMIRKGFKPVPATRCGSVYNGKGILIPKKSLVPEELKPFVKDYIFEPKSNQYQSLHIAFEDKKGRFIEIQIRTLSMHVRAEEGTANWCNYKRNMYNTKFVKYDRSKVNINGFQFCNNKLFDYIGLEEPYIIFSRRKFFSCSKTN